MKDLISIQRVATLHPQKNVRGLFTKFIDEIEATFKTTFRVAQAWRTFAEQQAIFDQPHDHKDNDKDGKIDETDEKVTSAPAGKSFHNYALAVDLVEIKNGKINWNFDYKKLEPIAKKYGITAGIAWGDAPHFQITFGIPQKDYIKVLYKKFLTKDFIPGTQYVNL
jgi:peptidoglycan LD-endopeptidase CwlK